MRLLLCFTSILLLASPAFADDDAPMPQSSKWLSTGWAYGMPDGRDDGQSLRLTRVGPDFLIHFPIHFPVNHNESKVHHKSKFALDEAKTVAASEGECPVPAACPACNAKDATAAHASEVTTTLIHLKHASAERVAAKVSAMLEREHNMIATANGVVVSSPVIIVPNSTTNSLDVMANEQFINETKQLIAQCDVEPKQFNVRLKMTATQGEGEDAKKVVVSPTLVTVEGMPGSIVIGIGQNGSYRFDVEVVEAAGEANESTAQQTKLECSELVLLAPGEEPAECPLISQARILRLMMGAPSQCDNDACCSQKEAAASDSATAASDSCACENCACEKCACSTGSCTDGACASGRACACSSSKQCACASAKQCACASCEKCASCPQCARAFAKQCACTSSKECSCTSAKSKCNCSAAASACSKCQQCECPACASKSDGCPAECLAAKSAAANCFDSGCETIACTAPTSADCECKPCSCENCACYKCTSIKTSFSGEPDEVVATISGTPIIAAEILAPYAKQLEELRRQMSAGELKSAQAALVKRDLPRIVRTEVMIAALRETMSADELSRLEKHIDGLFSQMIHKKAHALSIYSKLTEEQSMEKFEASLLADGSSIEMLRDVFRKRSMAQAWLEAQQRSISQAEETDSDDSAAAATSCPGAACHQCECTNCECTECPGKSSASAECANAQPCCEDHPAVACARAEDQQHICTPAPLQAAEAPMIKVEFGAGGPLLTISGQGILQTASEAAADNSECQDAACESRRIQLAGHRALTSDENAVDAVASDSTSIVPAIHQVADIVTGDNPLMTKDQLIHFIKHSVEPSSWDIKGGEGTIDVLMSSLSLVVRQDAKRQAETRKIIDQLHRIAQLRNGISPDGDEIRSTTEPQSLDHDAIQFTPSSGSIGNIHFDGCPLLIWPKNRD